MANQPLGHLKISPGNMDQAVCTVTQLIRRRSRAYCIPLHLTKYVVSKQDAKLTDVINGADLVIADGVPIKWLAKRAGLKNVHRVTGVDLAERLLLISRANTWSVYILGASPENLNLAIERIRQRFNSPNIAGSHHGYFSDNDVDKVIEDINRSRPDILFLGLGMPQKEHFLHDHRSKLDVPFCMTVGGAVDIWAGVKKRAPRFVQRLGMEWFVRSIYDHNKARNVLRYGWQFAKELAFYSEADFPSAKES